MLSARCAIILNTVSLATTQSASSTLNRSIILSNGIIARIKNHTITTLPNVTITVTKPGHSIVAI